MRTAAQGASEGFSVMEEISVASMHDKHDNITGRESGQTSLRYFTRENLAIRLMRQSR
jgi:hypothetical protein